MDPKIAKLLLPDRVHPDPLAHWVMAEALLKGWNAPALVSEVTLDGQAGKLTDARMRGGAWCSRTRANCVDGDWSMVCRCR